MHDHPCLGFCQLYQTIPARNSCVQGRIRSGAVSETNRWAVPSGSLWQQSPYAPQEKLPFHKLEFLALKWVVTEHFKEYLPYQPFLVKTNNNPLTYIMMTPNLNATGHQWVGALARFNFQLEYQKGLDNTVVDILSWVTTCLDPDMVR